MKKTLPTLFIVFSASFLWQSCKKETNSFYSDLEACYECKATYRTHRYIHHPSADFFILSTDETQKDTIINLNCISNIFFNIPEVNPDLFFKLEDGNFVLLNEDYQTEEDPLGVKASGIINEDSLFFNYIRIANTPYFISEEDKIYYPPAPYYAKQFRCKKK